MVSVHQKWIKALELYKQSVPILNEGIDNFDVDLIKKASALVEEGNKLTNEATKELEEIAEKARQ